MTFTATRHAEMSSCHDREFPVIVKNELKRLPQEREVVRQITAESYQGLNSWYSAARGTLQDSADHSCSDQTKSHLNDKNIAVSSKIRLMRSLATSIFLYAGETSGLATTILQGTVQGGRRKGKQRKRWEGNIKE